MHITIPTRVSNRKSIRHTNLSECIIEADKKLDDKRAETTEIVVDMKSP
jgi:hypothetical protein